MLYSIVGMLAIILDQLVKFWVDKNINWTAPIHTVIPGVFSLVRVLNDGAAFSFLSGSGARVWFIVLTGIFALLVVLALATNFISGKFGRWCLVLVTAGGLANMIDRIRYGYVIDMFKIELFDFAVFNVADIFITVFSIAFILYILFGGEKMREPDADVFDDEDLEDNDRPAREPVKMPRKAKASRAVSYDDDDEEDIPPVRSDRKAKKASPARSKPSYDDTDDEFDDTPKRRADRSAAAAASAYSRRTAEPSRRPSREEMPEPEEPARRRRPAEGTSDPVRRRPAENPGRTNPAPRQPQRPAQSSEPERRKPAARPASDNPFAEWEQANAKAAFNARYNVYNEEAEGRPAVEKTPEVSAVSEKKAPAKSEKPDNEFSFSDDLDLDSILNEFK